MLPRSPQDARRLPIDGIDLVQLGAGVAAAEVGQAQVRSEQVGAVAQKLRRIELGRDRVIPPVFEKLQRCRRCHDPSGPLGLVLLDHHSTG